MGTLLRSLATAGLFLALFAQHAAAETVFSFRSDPQDYVGAGQTRRFTPADGNMFMEITFKKVIFNLDSPSGYWTAAFSAPNYSDLVPGVYENAERFQTPGNGGLDVGGEGRGCNTTTGRFVVHEVVVAPGDVVQRFAVDFVQHCEGFAPALTGSIRFNSAVPLPSTQAPAPPGVPVAPQVQGLWWSGPQENGWGMSIVQHADQLFAVIYAYDSAGAPTWYVVPGGTWNPQRTIFTGTIYTPHGTPFFAYDPSHWSVGAPRGTITLAFQGSSSATFDYTIDGVSGRKAILPQAFGRDGYTPQAGLSDMWWGGAAQNGWGIALLQQQSVLFSVWFTYGANGAPQWLVMLDGVWTSPSTYEGRIYRTNGSPWLGVYDPALFRTTNVGSFKLRFVGDGAVLEYSVDGHIGSMPLVRQAF
ncbi:hypothetical protein [Usitatibacter rugosus]|nr:hypothetical protein [Usitatibacter rugosus]